MMCQDLFQHTLYLSHYSHCCFPALLMIFPSTVITVIISSPVAATTTSLVSLTFFLLFVSLVFCCFSCDCWVLLKMVSLSYSPHKTECFFLCGKQSILGVLFVSLLIFQPFSVVFCIVAVVLFIAAFPQNLCIRER